MLIDCRKLYPIGKRNAVNLYCIHIADKQSGKLGSPTEKLANSVLVLTRFEESIQLSRF